MFIDFSRIESSVSHSVECKIRMVIFTEKFDNDTAWHITWYDFKYSFSFICNNKYLIQFICLNQAKANEIVRHLAGKILSIIYFINTINRNRILDFNDYTLFHANIKWEIHIFDGSYASKKSVESLLDCSACLFLISCWYLKKSNNRNWRRISKINGNYSNESDFNCKNWFFFFKMFFNEPCLNCLQKEMKKKFQGLHQFGAKRR